MTEGPFELFARMRNYVKQIVPKWYQYEFWVISLWETQTMKWGNHYTLIPIKHHLVVPAKPGEYLTQAGWKPRCQTTSIFWFVSTLFENLTVRWYPTLNSRHDWTLEGLWSLETSKSPQTTETNKIFFFFFFIFLVFFFCWWQKFRVKENKRSKN